MGATRGQYLEEFSKGSVVQIADRPILEQFRREWRLHHPLDERQLAYASRTATVAAVSFYHGGDELYQLEGIPGTWHEACLRRVQDAE